MERELTCQMDDRDYLGVCRARASRTLAANRNPNGLSNNQTHVNLEHPQSYT